MRKKEILKLAILTKSNKARRDGSFGSCVAGVTASGEWIRLVSDIDGDSISENCFGQISLPKVIETEVERVPLAYQTENAILLSYSITQDDVKNYVRNIPTVNENGIFGNTLNKLTEYEMRRNQGTLRFVNVENLTTYRRENEKCKAEFIHQGNNYTEIAMTDPNWYAAKGTNLKVGNAHIVISLPNNPPFLKFIAAICQYK
jgi:hypothetical protein